MTYSCLYCLREFASTYALKRHISEKHQYDVSEDDEVTFQSDMPYEETDLWDDDDNEASKLPYREEPGIWDDDFITKDDEAESEISLKQTVES